MLLTILGCSPDASPSNTGGVDPPGFACNLDPKFLVAGAVRDGIPSIDQPDFVMAGEGVPAYLDSESRVIGLKVGETYYAIPHNVLWFHEIVNLEVDGRRLAVTYCPLTGSSLAFDRSGVGGATFGVSGLLFQNNLVLYDRNDPSSLWPQMLAEARCGPRSGSPLVQWPVVEVRWTAWLDLHPETLVLSADQGIGVDYRQENYPYGFYEDYSVTSFFVPSAMPILDRRRPVKERVLGVPRALGFTPEDGGSEGGRGIAFPFDALTALPGRFQAVEFAYEGEPAVVLWNDDARGGMAYRSRTESGIAVTLRPTSAGTKDLETGSVWTIDGLATSGPLTGSRLSPIERAYVSFWGAWAAFHPETELWEG